MTSPKLKNKIKKETTAELSVKTLLPLSEKTASFQTNLSP